MLKYETEEIEEGRQVAEALLSLSQGIGEKRVSGEGKEEIRDMKEEKQDGDGLKDEIISVDKEELPVDLADKEGEIPNEFEQNIRKRLFLAMSTNSEDMTGEEREDDDYEVDVVKDDDEDGISSTSRSTKKKRGNLPKEAVRVLKYWLEENRLHPYPSEPQKVQLSSQLGLTMVQVNNWFINARRRYLDEMLWREGKDPNLVKIRRKAGAARKGWKGIRNKEILPHSDEQQMVPSGHDIAPSGHDKSPSGQNITPFEIGTPLQPPRHMETSPTCIYHPTINPKSVSDASTTSNWTYRDLTYPPYLISPPSLPRTSSLGHEPANNTTMLSVGQYTQELVERTARHLGLSPHHAATGHGSCGDDSSTSTSPTPINYSTNKSSDTASPPRALHQPHLALNTHLWRPYLERASTSAPVLPLSPWFNLGSVHGHLAAYNQAAAALVSCSSPMMGKPSPQALHLRFLVDAMLKQVT